MADEFITNSTQTNYLSSDATMLGIRMMFMAAHESFDSNFPVNWETYSTL